MTTEKKGFVEKITVLVEEKIAPPLIKLSQNRYLDSLSRTFTTFMPYLIVGALACLILNLPGLFAEGTGLGMPAVQEFLSSIITPAAAWITQINVVCFDLIALFVAGLNSFYLGSYYSKKDNRIAPIATAIISMVSIFCLLDFPSYSANFDWPSYALGAPSIFGAIIVSIVSTEIYRFLVAKNITIKMPEGVPQMVADAFTSLIPVVVNLIVFGFIGKGIAGFDLLTVFGSIFSKLVVAGSGWLPQFLGFFVDRLLWFVGIHGSNVVSSVMTPIWTQMNVENIAAYANGSAIPYMFTDQWINCYVRVSVFPIALLLCLSKCKRFKTLGKLSIGGTIFNIAEPIMYGFPIVLNPLMFVPWVIGWCATFLVQVLFSMIGLTPAIVAQVVWTMPVPLMAFIGSGFNPIAIVTPIVQMILIFLIFLPFFKIMEKQELAAEAENEKTSA